MGEHRKRAIVAPSDDTHTCHGLIRLEGYVDAFRRDGQWESDVMRKQKEKAKEHMKMDEHKREMTRLKREKDELAKQLEKLKKDFESMKKAERLKNDKKRKRRKSLANDEEMERPKKRPNLAENIEPKSDDKQDERPQVTEPKTISS